MYDSTLTSLYKVHMLPREQVVDKDANAVMDEVESAIYQAAVTILKGSGFSFGVPSRSKGNQLYVPELDRIVLKDSMSQRPFGSSATCRKAVITARVLGLIHELCTKRIHVTKRDLFYTDVNLFEVQPTACHLSHCFAVMEQWLSGSASQFVKCML